MADAAWATRGRESPAELRLIAAALAGGGAGLAVLVLSWSSALVVGMLFHGLIGPVAGFLVLGWGAACGLVAGYTGASFAEGWPVPVVLGAWVIWAVGVVFTAGAAFVPMSSDWPMLAAGLVGTLVGAGVRGLVSRRRARRGLLGAGWLGALAGFAILALGVAALGWAAVGLRPLYSSADSYANVYLRGMGAALWAVIILATALAAGLPVATGGRPLRRPVRAAALGLVLFVALGELTSAAFTFYLSCSVGLFGGGAY